MKAPFRVALSWGRWLCPQSVPGLLRSWEVRASGGWEAGEGVPGDSHVLWLFIRGLKVTYVLTNLCRTDAVSVEKPS